MRVTNPTGAPWRKVVMRLNYPDHDTEELECGHIRDCYSSEPVAPKRRCRQCAENLQKQVADYEAELERHSTDRVNQRKQVAELRKQISELEPRAAFGDQCWQDSCEGALVPSTLLKAQTERMEKAEAELREIDTIKEHPELGWYAACREIARKYFEEQGK